MPETPARVLRVAGDVVDQAAAAARRAQLPDDFATLARAGLILIGSGAVGQDDLSWAIERARLRAGWPAREERAT
jgi:hypothetical protein